MYTQLSKAPNCVIICDVKSTNNTNTRADTETHAVGDKHGGEWMQTARPQLCVCVCQTHFLTSEHQHAAPQREKGEVVVPTQLKGLWPPCQHNLFSTSRPPSLAASLFPSLPLASPPTRVYFCQLPYSCLHSVFARTHKTFLVRVDEALLPTVGTPG